MQEKKHYKLHKVKKRWVTIAVTATAATVLFAVGAQTQADQVANPQEQTTTTQTDNQSDKVANQEVNTQASAEQATAQTPSQDQTPAAEQKTTQETPEVTLNQDSSSSAGDQGQADQANQNNQSQDAQKSEANPSTDNAHAANQTQEGSKDQATATEADNGAQANSFYEKDGKWYYADANKQNVTGWQTINGQKLYFNEDGSQVKGREITDNGATYYFDQDTGDLWTNRFANQQEYDFDILATDHDWYYCGQDGKRVTGWQTIDGKKMYFTTEDDQKAKPRYSYNKQVGSQIKGRIQTIDGKDYYFDQDTGELWTNRNVTIGQQTFHLDENGVATPVGEKKSTGHFITKELQNNYGHYSAQVYVDQYNNAISGLQTKDGKDYYFNSYGVQLKNELATLDDGKDYFFALDTGEKVKNQFVNINFNNNRYYNPVFNGWLYFGQDGAAVQGWQTIDGKRMYFLTNKDADSAPDYARQVSAQVKDRLQTIDGKDYYFDNDGVLQTNKDVTINGKNYHLDENGVATEKTAQDNNNTGDTQTGGHYEQKDFYLGEYDAHYTGWVYIDKDGKTVTGLQTINGKKVYFFSNGEQARNQFANIDDNTYYFGEDGQMVTNQTVEISRGNSLHYGGYQPEYNGWLHLGADGSADNGYKKIIGTEYGFRKTADGKGEWYRK